MGTVVACLRISHAGPQILLSGHLEGTDPILIYRVSDYDAAVSDLRALLMTISPAFAPEASRAAVFTESPSAVKSTASPSPTVPTKATPV
jgi:hypothetical protein